MSNLIDPTIWAIPLVDGDTLFMDNSSQERTMTCPRSAGFYTCHVREGNRPKPALEFGKIIHKILEERYRNHGIYCDASCVQSMVNVATEQFTTYEPDPSDFRNYGTAIDFVKKYTTQYALEDFELVRFTDGTPFVEQKFALPLGIVPINTLLWVRDTITGEVTQKFVHDLKIVQKGKIDLCYRREGRLYGLDHKTTSMMGPSFFNEFELASQIHGYSWAIEHLVGELPSGFVINGLGLRKPTPFGKSHEYIRHTVAIQPGLVLEWIHDTLHIVREFVLQCAAGYLPKHTKWCVGKYGACEYKPVCGMPDWQQRMMSLYSNEYRAVTWDPLTES